MSNLVAEYGAIELIDNQVHIDLNSYKGKAYIDAIKVVDIASAMILDRKSLGQIGKSAEGIPNDVILKHTSGETEYITRKQLAQQYKTLSGKSILMFKMKANTPFHVKRACNIPYKVMLLPPGFVSHYRGKVIDSKAYAVIPCSQGAEQGESELDTSRVQVIPASKFKKSFVIPDNQLIANSRKRAEALRTKGKQNFSIANYIKFRISEYNKENGLTDSNYSMETEQKKKKLDKQPNIVKTLTNNILKQDTVQKQQKESRQSISEVIANENKQTAPKQASDSKYQFKAIARILNSNNVLVGFTLIDRKGKRYQKDLTSVSMLANQKLIANISLVTSQDNKKQFLRGNGIRIEDLPKVVIN